MKPTSARRASVILGAAFIGAMFNSNAARADAIDGAWCSPDGRHLTIAGPKITTPGGAQTQGNYTRHAFNYVAPDKEAGAGATIYMNLLNETTAQVREGTPVAQPVVWKRCEHIT